MTSTAFIRVWASRTGSAIPSAWWSCIHTPGSAVWAVGIANGWWLVAERCYFDQFYLCTEISYFHLSVCRYNMCLVYILPKLGRYIWACTCPVWILISWMLILYWCNSMRLEEEGEVEFHCDHCISFLKVNTQQLTPEHATVANICLLFLF